MLKRFFLFILFLMITQPAPAEVIYLKDGSVVKGSIANRTSYSVTMVGGRVPKKYMMSQIDRILTDAEFAAEENQTQAKGSTTAAQTGLSARKQRLIMDLIETNGTKKALDETIRQFVANLPPEQKNRLNTIMETREIINRLVPVYDRYYSEGELSELISFYKSPAGQKLLEVTPEITREAMKMTITHLYQKANKSQ